MLTISKTITFAAAHSLPRYDGPCFRLHGHEWKLEVTVRRPRGDIDEPSGMVMDFKLLKELLQKEVVDRFDHYLVNDQIENPTAENMIHVIRGLLQTLVESNGHILHGLRLWETPDSCCEWSPE